MSDILAKYFEKCQKNGQLTGISFELTNKCNLNCIHCYRVHGDSYLSNSLFYSAIDEAESLGALLVSFSGGEPTLHPKFHEYAHHVVSRGMYLSVLTNGTLLTTEILKKLSPYRNLFFQISLYGYDTNSAESITGQAFTFQSTLDLISTIQEIGFDFRVILLVTSETAEALPNLIEMCLQKKIKIGLLFQLSAKENGVLSPLKLAAHDGQVNHLLSFEGKWPQDIQDPVVFKSDIENSCRACNAAVSSLGVRVDGTVVPCQVFSGPVLGHIEHNTLRSIIEGEERKSFLEKNIIPEKCRRCDLFFSCQRCPADAFHETGSLTGIPAESCRIAKLRAKFHIDSGK